MTTTLDWYDTALRALDSAADSVAYQYSKWGVQKDDLYQDAWEWALRHPLLVSSFLDKEEQDVRGLERVVSDYLRLLAQKEKAQKTGYHVDDVTWYTPRVVAELLATSMDLEAALAPTAGASDSEGGRTGNPHGQSDFVASLLDVRNAWICTAFRNDESRLIEARYVDEMSWDHMAASFGHEVDEVKRRVAIGLRRMVDFLGGHRGRSCPVDCPDCTANYDDGGESQ